MKGGLDRIVLSTGQHVTPQDRLALFFRVFLFCCLVCLGDGSDVVGTSLSLGLGGLGGGDRSSGLTWTKLKASERASERASVGRMDGRGRGRSWRWGARTDVCL